MPTPRTTEQSPTYQRAVGRHPTRASTSGLEPDLLGTSAYGLLS